MEKRILMELAVIITGLVLFFYNTFNGNFISKIIAKNTVENHLEEHYSDKKHHVVHGGYNFKDAAYNFDMTFYEGENAWTYTFVAGSRL